MNTDNDSNEVGSNEKDEDKKVYLYQISENDISKYENLFCCECKSFVPSNIQKECPKCDKKFCISCVKKLCKKMLQENNNKQSLNLDANLLSKKNLPEYKNKNNDDDDFECKCGTPGKYFKNERTELSNIMNLKFHCKNRNLGCEYIMNYYEIPLHIESVCAYSIFKCKYFPDCKDTNLKRGELKSHELNCKYNVISCSECKEFYKKLDEENHKNNCIPKLYSCIECKKQIQENMKEFHKSDCLSLKKVICKDCQASFKFALSKINRHSCIKTLKQTSKSVIKNFYDQNDRIEKFNNTLLNSLHIIERNQENHAFKIEQIQADCTKTIIKMKNDYNENENENENKKKIENKALNQYQNYENYENNEKMISNALSENISSQFKIIKDEISSNFSRLKAQQLKNSLSLKEMQLKANKIEQMIKDRNSSINLKGNKTSSGNGNQQTNHNFHYESEKKIILNKILSLDRKIHNIENKLNSLNNSSNSSDSSNSTNTSYSSNSSNYSKELKKISKQNLNSTNSNMGNADRNYPEISKKFDQEIKILNEKYEKNSTLNSNFENSLSQINKQISVFKKKFKLIDAERKSNNKALKSSSLALENSTQANVSVDNRQMKNFNLNINLNRNLKNIIEKLNLEMQSLKYQTNKITKSYYINIKSKVIKKKLEESKNIMKLRQIINNFKLSKLSKKKTITRALENYSRNTSYSSKVENYQKIIFIKDSNDSIGNTTSLNMNNKLEDSGNNSKIKEKQEEIQKINLAQNQTTTKKANY